MKTKYNTKEGTVLSDWENVYGISFPLNQTHHNHDLVTRKLMSDLVEIGKWKLIKYSIHLLLQDQGKNLVPVAAWGMAPTCEVWQPNNHRGSTTTPTLVREKDR